MRIGIFGGSFNPPHLGHINSVKTLIDRVGLDQVLVVPNFQNPLKKMVEGPSALNRLEMTKRAFADLGNKVVVTDMEVVKGKVNYTIETLTEIKKKNPEYDLHFIMGIDLLPELSRWKKWEEILEMAHLIVTSRPGFEFPDSAEELPEFLRPLVKQIDFNIVELKTGKEIQFVQLPDMNVSATDVRKRLHLGKKVSQQLPLSVEAFIRDEGLYKPLKEKIKDYQQFTEYCAGQLFARKAIQVRGFDLRKITAPTEFALVASGTSTRHAASLAENLLRSVKEEFNLLPQGIEGLSEGRWVLIDYGSLMVHVFYDYVRSEYSIEKLWMEAKDLALKDPNSSERSPSEKQPEKK